MKPDFTRLLVIGYGNTLRQDDGVGPRVAALLAELAWPGVEAIACPQLVPEHAALLAQARTVVFVDAMWGNTGPVRLRRLMPRPSAQMTAHAAEPPALLAMAREVYGRCPRAWMLAVPARQMDYGDELSAAAGQGVEAALNVLNRFIRVRRLHRAPRPAADPFGRLVTREA